MPYGYLSKLERLFSSSFDTVYITLTFEEAQYHSIHMSIAHSASVSAAAGAL